MKFRSAKQALGWSAARRRPALIQLRADERVQERSSFGDDWVASTVFSALARVGVDPHGPMAEEVIAWATRSDHDVDEDGRSWSTHPADMAAEQLSEALDDASAQIDELRRQAATSASTVVGVVQALEVELLELGLLEQRPPKPATMPWYALVDGEVMKSTRVGAVDELDEDSQREQAELAELAALPVFGPLEPPRDLVRARVIFEPIGRELASGTGPAVGGEITSFAQLDRAVARFASVSERTARTTRLNVWGVRGNRGRPAKKGLAGHKLASQGIGATDSCAL